MSRILEDHGTKLIQLKPQNIIQAAAADLRLKAKKAEAMAVAKAQELPPDRELMASQYLFAGNHVRKAGDVCHLLALAAAAPGVGLRSSKKATRIIYGDADLLSVAIGVAAGVEV